MSKQQQFNKDGRTEADGMTKLKCSGTQCSSRFRNHC